MNRMRKERHLKIIYQTYCNLLNLKRNGLSQRRKDAIAYVLILRPRRPLVLRVHTPIRATF